MSMVIENNTTPADAQLFTIEHESAHDGIHGLIVPMFTPVRSARSGFEIDVDADIKLTDALIDGGADTLFILGNAGMFQKLTLEQKIKHIDTVLQAVGQNKQKIPVVVGVSASDVSASCILAQHSESKGAAGVVYIPSYGTGDIGVKTMDVLNSTKTIPLIFYNNPSIQMGRQSLDMDFLKEFVEHPRVIGIKNSTQDLKTYEKMMDELASPKFRVYVGEASNIVPAMDLLREGKIDTFAGCVPVQANLSPEIFAKFLKHDDTVSGEQLQTFIQENHTKTILEKMVASGMIDDTTREVFVR
jgi:dihydrodipicolinate synthase/N-acetylneuraminate lyase